MFCLILMAPKRQKDIHITIFSVDYHTGVRFIRSVASVLVLVVRSSSSLLYY